MVVANIQSRAPSPTDRVVQPGDIIITPHRRPVRADLPMVLGQPRWRFTKYAILKKAMGLGMEAAQTGAPASAIAAAINRTLTDAGYEKYCRPPFMRVRGHGLGCGSSAPGNLEDDNQTRLEEGMTFIIHPNQYIPETGYLTLTIPGSNDPNAESLMKSSWDIYEGIPD
jgi:hypothetical protein